MYLVLPVYDCKLGPEEDNPTITEVVGSRHPIYICYTVSTQFLYAIFNSITRLFQYTYACSMEYTRWFIFGKFKHNISMQNALFVYSMKCQTESILVLKTHEKNIV